METTFDQLNPPGPPGDPPLPFNQRPKKASAPKDGSAGVAGAPKYVSRADLGKRASISQVLLYFHSAKLDFLAERYQDTSTKLGWLADITAENPGASTPVGTEIGSPSKSGVAPTSAEWNSIRTQVLLLVYRLGVGLDYFGNPRNFVPALAQDQYFNLLKDLLATGETVQATARAYWQQGQDVKAKISPLKQQIQSLKDSTKALQDKADSIDAKGPDGKSPLDILQDEIKQLSDQITSVKAQIPIADGRFQQAVASAGSGCSVQEILTIAGATIAFATAIYGNVDGIITAAGALESLKAVTSVASAVSDVNTIVTFITKAEGDVNNMTAAWNKYKGVLDGPPIPPILLAVDANKIGASIQKFDDAIDPYLNLPEAQAFKAVVHQYLGLVQTRNSKLVLFSSNAQQAAGYRADASQRLLESSRVALALEKVQSPALVECEVMMERTLDLVKQDILRELYLARRAIEYQVLSNISFPLYTSDITQLTALRDRLQQELQDHHAERAWEQLPQVSLKLDESNCGQAFRDFRRTGKLVFSINGQNNPFPDEHMVITLKDAALTVPGARVGATNVIAAQLYHSGVVKIQDEYRVVHRYIHNPRNTTISFRPSDGSFVDTIENNLGGKDEEYIFLSPFTTWTLFINPNAHGHAGLDLSGVSSIGLKFSGHFLPPKGLNAPTTMPATQQ